MKQRSIIFGYYNLHLLDDLNYNGKHSFLENFLMFPHFRIANLIRSLWIFTREWVTQKRISANDSEFPLIIESVFTFFEFFEQMRSWEEIHNYIILQQLNDKSVK